MSFRTSIFKAKFGKHLCAISIAGALSACAIADVKQQTPEKERPQKYLPFVLGFTAEGLPVVMDKSGNPIEPERASLPVKATEIEALQTISYIKYKGSCKILMYMGGKYYQFVLPDEYCKQQVQ